MFAIDMICMIWQPVSDETVWDESEIGGLSWAGLGCKVQ